MHRSAIRAAHAALVILLGTVACNDSASPVDPVTPVDPITVQTTTLAEAIEGRAYTQQLTAEGGSGPYTWVLAAGSLPSGLTLSPAGVIAGTPTAPALGTLWVRVTDAGGRSATANLALPVVQALAVHTWELPEGSVGDPLVAQLQAVGGRGARAWSVAGEGAAWLVVSPAGVLSGIPAEAGSFEVTVAVADESGQEASRTFTVVVQAPLAVAPTSLPEATQGRVYAAQLVATGGDGAYTWSVVSGELPAGTSLTTGGALIGTPSAGGAFTFTARVTDGAGREAAGSLALLVALAPTIQTGGLPPADPGAAYTVQLLATGGTGGYTWSLIEGALPAGLVLSTEGTLSGIPTIEGSASFTVRVTDAAGATHSQTLSLVVAQIDALVRGVAVTLAGAEGSVRYFVFEVPPEATKLTVAMSGGTGDADLYIRRGVLPQAFAYDCRPLRTGNDETCTVPESASGAWYIMIRGHSEHAGVRLEATHDG